MKIGLICPYNSALGGVQEIVRAMHAELSQRGRTVKIITAQSRVLGDADTSNMIFLGRAIDLQRPNHTTAPLSSGLSMEAIEQVMESARGYVDQYESLYEAVPKKHAGALARV